MGRAAETGRRGEELAEAYVQQLGWDVLARNFSAPGGEIDLVCVEGGGSARTLVFVEVKTRRTTAFGEPEAALTTRKIDRLSSAADAYIYANGEEDVPCRFDCIGIILAGPAHQPEIRHFKDITGF